MGAGTVANDTNRITAIIEFMTYWRRPLINNCRHAFFSDNGDSHAGKLGSPVRGARAAACAGVRDGWLREQRFAGDREAERSNPAKGRRRGRRRKNLEST